MSGPPSFPRQHARTRGFTLGEPRGFSVAAGGGRVAFLRSLAGDDLDLAGPVLEDQVEALHAVAGDHPELDLGRVAIRPTGAAPCWRTPPA